MKTLGAVLTFVACALGAQAQTACRQALALGLDVSGSVDAIEYRLQLDGLAKALRDDAVQAAILEYPQAPVRLMVFEWSGLYHQRDVIGWTTLASPEQIEAVAQRLTDTAAVHINDPSTAIAAAMKYGAQALATQRNCWQKTLDVSGDGPANIGLHPGDLTESDLGQITINGLVIGPQGRANTSKNLNNVKSLESYYRSVVLRGPGAFAEVALDHADFAEAMRRKLIRELQSPALSRRGTLLRVQ